MRTLPFVSKVEGREEEAISHGEGVIVDLLVRLMTPTTSCDVPCEGRKSHLRQTLCAAVEEGSVGGEVAIRCGTRALTAL